MSLQPDSNHGWHFSRAVLNKARLGHQDVAFYLLGAESSLVNLLGIHYLMMQPLWVRSPAPWAVCVREQG